MKLKGLEPTALWNHFENLNAVPRPSKKEEKVIAFMVDFGKQLGLETLTDSVGNIIIKKPATQGMESRETVIMQSHVDMVHQKNNDTVFDFENEGIKMLVDGDWVKAEGTTLGADNGIGVAAIMAVLSSKDIPHPAIEAMFTVDEETGMTGAKELDPSFYEGTILLNLDTEEDDELSIGCAGGIDTNTSYNYQEADLPEGNWFTFKIGVKGLVGGHSGMDIHRGRGNANKLLTRLLFECPVRFCLHKFQGGGLRNAIPREAEAYISVLEEQKQELLNFVQSQFETYKNELSPVEPNLTVFVEEALAKQKIVPESECKRMLQTLYAVHNGVFKMSLTMDDLVETSSSLAQVKIAEGSFETKSLQRSSVESTKNDVANAIRAPFELFGANVEQSGDYPGWEPNPNSPLLKLMIAIYEENFEGSPRVLAGHAGLECGILGQHLPNVDMISFGPTIRFAHSPDECVQISSVLKFWEYLKKVLASIPEKV